MTSHHLPDRILLRDLLENLSVELQNLATAAVAIDERVGAVIAGGTLGSDKLCVALQGTDHLAQTGRELATFVTRLARSMDDDVVVPISGPIQSIGLRSLAKSLVGQGDTQKGEVSNGNVDIF